MTKPTKDNGLALLSLLSEKVCLFEGLTIKEVAWILRRATRNALRADHVLLSPANSREQMYVILSGSVSIRAQRDGHWEEIAVLGPGASVGEMSLIDSAPRSATAICTQETNVLEFASDWLVGSPPSLGVKVYQNFSRILAKRLRTTNALFEEMKAWPDASDALGRQLVNLGLDGLDLSGINATKARLSRADLSGVDLRGANLSGADLRGAILDGTDLRETDLTKAVSDKNDKHREYWERVQESVRERATAEASAKPKIR